MAVNAKARVAQLTGSRSITAAAELSGNLWVFLLSVESAPFGRVGLKFGSGNQRAGEDTHPYEMGESSGFAVGADDLGGPLRGLCDSRAHPHPPRMRSAPSPL